MADENQLAGQFEGPEENRMADWLEGSLKKYATSIITRKSRGAVEFTTEEIKEFPISVTSLCYSSKGREDPSELETDAGSHTISKISITYCFNRDGNHHPQFFVSKACRALCNDELGKDLDSKSASRIQEINFYTKVITDLEDWAYFNDYPLILPLPYCYFGNYEFSKIERVDERTKKYLTSIGIKYKGYDEDMKRLHETGSSSAYDPTENFEYEVNSVIVLENVAKNGYEKYSQFNLTVEQVELAATKIAEVHAISYAWETRHKINIKPKWPIFPKSKDFAEFCSDSILQAFPLLIKLMQNYFTDESSLVLIYHLEALEKKIKRKMVKFIRPAHFPLPNAILHMDLRPENIFFLKESSESENNSKHFATKIESQLPIATDVENKQTDAACTMDENMNQLQIALQDGLKEKQPLNVIKDCKFIGWNMCNYGSALHDVAFLIFSSLSPELRRNSTVDILKKYFGAFRDICEEMDVELPFDCQMLYNEFPNSLLFAALMSVRYFNENSTKLDAECLKHFAEVFNELLELNYL